MTLPNDLQNVLSPPARSAIFLVAVARPGAEADLRDVLAEIGGLTGAVSFRAPADELNCVVGIGSDLWDRMYGEQRPRDLHPFRTIEGARHTAVATPGDLLFHLRAGREDLCFELARLIGDRLAGLADIVDEVHGFTYFDQRDLLGFVDGTENPRGNAARQAVIVGDEDPRFAGGSYVLVQKYTHDLDAWEALSVEEQERVIGREKLSDVEIPDDEKASDSHVALTTITEPDGTEREIVRANMAFGRVGSGEFGTYFIGYAADPDVIELMLERMFIGEPPGNHDRILDFSTAVTGGLFFVPAAEFLEDPDASVVETDQADHPPADDPPPAGQASAGSATADGSLGIGSLNRSGAP